MGITESGAVSEFERKESDLTVSSNAETKSKVARSTAKVDNETGEIDQYDAPSQTSNENKVSVADESTASSATDEQTETKERISDGSAHAHTEKMVQEDDELTTPEEASDVDLIARAETHVRGERLLEAARALRRVKDQSLLEEKHWRALQKAEHVEATVVDLTSSPDEGWTKQGESHGNYDTIIYYKVDEHTRLTARIETPIEASLLVPLLSVFNESELYEACLPRFKGMGISQSIKLRQTGRGNQIIAVKSYLPWPLTEREAVIEATAVDDISTNNHIVVKMETRVTGEEDGLIPPPEKDVVRIDFDGGMLFRKCPEDHPAFAKSKHPDHQGPMVLVCLTMFVDAHVQYVPQSLINFATRTVIGRMWAGLLDVAEGIRDGRRPQHAEAITAKRDLYEWVEQRVDDMIDGMVEVDAGVPATR